MANDKHIFIGIGGSGCQTVSQIKEKVYEKRFKEATAAKSRLEQMNDSYRFLFLDTDQRDIDEANKRMREVIADWNEKESARHAHKPFKNLTDQARSNLHAYTENNKTQRKEDGK